MLGKLACYVLFSHLPVYGVLQLQVRKSELEKRKNDDEQEEGWVACDACGAWVHMICGLFNKGRNDDDMPYHCPNCLLTGMHISLTPPQHLSAILYLHFQDTTDCWQCCCCQTLSATCYLHTSIMSSALLPCACLWPHLLSDTVNSFS